MPSRLVAVAAALLFNVSTAAAQPVSENGFRGEGAALCIAAGELLSAQPRADARVRDHVAAWHQVLHVMDGTDAQRQTALEEARSSLATKSLRAVQVTWTVACATRDHQIKYLVAHGSEERTRNNLAEEPGSALAVDAADRLNISALCLAGAEFFLRSKIQNVTPPIPDAGVLRAVQDRARKEIASASGSAAGKALLVDYFRFLYASADPRRVANQASQRITERCGVLP